MKKIAMFVLSILVFSQVVQAQKYFTREAKVSFFSEAPMENIEANNGTGTCVIDFESGSMEFAVLIKAFQFEKALMQEHFNENYMESHKYPKAVFKGKILSDDPSALTAEGEHDITVEGKITIHGVEQPLKTPATILVEDGEMKAMSKFELEVADFEISIPSVVRENIAKVIEVTIDADLEPLNQ